MSGIVGRNMVYSDTPGNGVTNDLDYFQKNLYPGQIPPVPQTGSGWREVPSQQEEFEAGLRNQIEESRKHDPERAQLILRQLLDHQLNRTIHDNELRRKPSLSM